MRVEAANDTALHVYVFGEGELFARDRSKCSVKRRGGGKPGIRSSSWSGVVPVRHDGAEVRRTTNQRTTTASPTCPTCHRRGCPHGLAHFQPFKLHYALLPLGRLSLARNGSSLKMKVLRGGIQTLIRTAGGLHGLARRESANKPVHGGRAASTGLPCAGRAVCVCVCLKSWPQRYFFSDTRTYHHAKAVCKIAVLWWFA